MRNLRCSKRIKLSTDDNIAATAWDPTDDSLILAFGPSEESPTISLKRLPESKSLDDAVPITSWDAPPPMPPPDSDLSVTAVPKVDRILDLHCFPDTKTITLVLAGGDIVVVHEDPQPGEDLIEIVGSVDAGITAAAWSPDEELLAVATGAGTLLFMTRDFDSIANITLSPQDVKVSNHVSVGWGKKETQFKGRGVAKTLRDPTMPEHVDEGTLSPLDDGRVSISWRGDGQFVAVNSILDAEPKRRIIRVYSREGVLESVSEPINGLEGTVSWKPSGQTIAGIQRNDDEIDVVFFERNGLRHGEFSLRLDRSEMESIGSSIDLRWNVDSTVLAVALRDRIQLWTVSNYHWYLKQVIHFDDTNSKTAAIPVWHSEKPLDISCILANQVRQLSYTFEVSRGSTKPPYDVGLVAVIDGKKLKLTPLRTANVPPPMAFDEVELPHEALDVDINEEGTEIAVRHEESVSLFTCNYASKPITRARLRDHSLTDMPNFSTRSTMPWHFRLTTNGVLSVGSADQALQRIPGCTSYIATDTHLIYTTSQHLLKFVHLHEGELDIPADDLTNDERIRNIERGAKIVTVMPSAYSLVLQMPRGNLETIYPRALVLAGTRESLNQRDYREAFLTCRTHRVDMNILHDYAPEQFMRDVQLFVKQVKKVEYVDLFLSSLSEEDVSQTLYRETITPSEKPLLNGHVNSHVNGDTLPPMITPKSKVNRICDAFLEELRKNSDSRLQNIVTAHVCKSPPDLEAGLRLVSDLRKSEQQERLEQAVEHICFLADVNQLYDTALGLYDLDVTLLVAQQSQKDPREYLPYLQALQDMQPLRQRFRIDDDLKRHRKALTHLHAMDIFDELKAYVAKHELHAAAIELYRYEKSPLNELMRLHADYLSSRNRFKEAGIAYEYISDHASAYEAYKAVTMWQECLSNAALVPVSQDELASLARDLAGSLEEAKDFSAAATIHLDFLYDLEGCARLLCKAYQFAQAIVKVVVRQRSDLLSTVIDSGLIEASATITELLAEMKTQLHAQVPRLRELRQKKAEDPMAFLDGAEGGDGDIPDNISLAPTDASTSGGTFMTQYTNRSMGTLATNATRKTSKNRRREERKRARGKKGTVYEEEYLVNSISRLIERLNAVGDDVGRLVEGLMRRAMRERALAVQKAMDEVISACRECMGEVYGSAKEVMKEAESGEAELQMSGTRPWGGQGVLWDAMTSQRQQMPVLKAFDRLALLE